MRILLPPSEAKRSGGRGKPLAGQAESAPWREARGPVLRALDQLCLQEDVASALRLPAGVAEAALVQNRAVLSSHTMPALLRYSGVLYAGLDCRRFSPQQLRLAKATVLIFSGLFGVLRGAEAIPAYRVPAKAVLPGVGVVATYWRSALMTLLPPLLGTGLTIDLRSSDYRAMWTPRAGSLNSYLALRVLSRRPDGTVSVVSYDSKLHKGRLTAALITRAANGEPVSHADDVLQVWQELGGSDGELTPDGQQLDLIT